MLWSLWVLEPHGPLAVNQVRTNHRPQRMPAQNDRAREYRRTSDNNGRHATLPPCACPSLLLSRVPRLPASSPTRHLISLARSGLRDIPSSIRCFPWLRRGRCTGRGTGHVAAGRRGRRPRARGRPWAFVRYQDRLGPGESDRESDGPCVLTHYSGRPLRDLHWRCTAVGVSGYRQIGRSADCQIGGYTNTPRGLTDARTGRSGARGAQTAEGRAGPEGRGAQTARSPAREGIDSPWGSPRAPGRCVALREVYCTAALSNRQQAKPNGVRKERGRCGGGGAGRRRRTSPPMSRHLEMACASSACSPGSIRAPAPAYEHHPKSPRHHQPPSPSMVGLHMAPSQQRRGTHAGPHAAPPSPPHRLICGLSYPDRAAAR